MARSRTLLVAAGALVLVVGALAWLRPRASDGPTPDAGPTAPIAGDAPGADATALAPRPAVGVGSPDGSAVAPAADPDAALPSDTVIVVGRVVDEVHRPVAGADVAVRVLGAAELGVRSGVDGTFRVRVDAVAPPHRVAVRATKAGATACRGLPAHLGHDPRSYDAGDLVLRAGGDLVVRVLDHGTPVAGATVFAASRRPQEPPQNLFDRTQPWIGWPFEATTTPAGVATLAGLPFGDVRLLAIATGPRRGETRLAHDAPGTVALDVDAARDVVVEVVERGTATPVVGVGLGLESASRDGRFPEDLLDEPLVAPPTDAQGRTTLRAFPRGRLAMLTVLGNGWRFPPWRGALPLDAASEHVRLEVPPPTLDVRLPAAFLDGPPAADGTEVRVEPIVGDQRGFWGDAGVPVVRATIERGALVIRGLRHPQLRGLARLPDGRAGRFESDPRQDVPLTFGRLRSLTVRVLDDADRPAAGIPIRVRAIGGGTLASPRRTDGSGRCRVDDLPAARLEVIAEAHETLVDTFRWGVFEEEIATWVDATAHDGVAELVLPPEIEARLAVTVEGTPGLPPGFDVLVAMHPAAVFAYASPREATWDPAAGTVVFRVRRPTGTRTLRGLAFAPGRPAVPLVFRADDAGTSLVARAELGAGGSVRTTVAGRSWADADVAVQRREAEGRWSTLAGTPRLDRGATSSDARFDDLPVGRYRLIHPATGLVSATTDVGANAVAALSLDLSRVGAVRVVVELPEGADPASLTIRRAGDGLALGDEEGGAWVRGRTEATFAVPGDRPVRLWADHPACGAAPGDGEVTITAPVPVVRLRLERRAR